MEPKEKKKSTPTQLRVKETPTRNADGEKGLRALETESQKKISNNMKLSAKKNFVEILITHRSKTEDKPELLLHRPIADLPWRSFFFSTPDIQMHCEKKSKPEQLQLCVNWEDAAAGREMIVLTFKNLLSSSWAPDLESKRCCTIAAS